MTRLERVDRMSPSYAGARYYLFDGGCVTVVFSLDGDNAGEALGSPPRWSARSPASDLAAQVQRGERRAGSPSTRTPGKADEP